jgi:CHAP domain
LIKLLLEVAQKEVGTREVGGNNCGARIRDYQRATNDRPLGPWPWCAAFASWCIREWVAQPAVRAARGWGTEEEAENRRSKTSQAFGYIDWARAQNQLVLPETAKPEPGMIVVYDFSHIGIVEQAIGKGSFIAIEGNTNGRGDRDSTTGDGVWERSGQRVWCEISFSGASSPSLRARRSRPQKFYRKEFRLRFEVSARSRENPSSSSLMKREWTSRIDFPVDNPA